MNNHLFNSDMNNTWLNNIVIKPSGKKTAHNVADDPQGIIFQSLPITMDDSHDGPG